MKIYYLLRQYCATLVLMVFAASCKGQGGVAGVRQMTVPGDTRIVKTQGSNQYGAIAGCIQDKAGNLWFASGGEGVYRYDGRLFTNYTRKDGLTSNNVLCVMEDKVGRIWLGTNAGLCRYDGKTFTAIPIFGGAGNGYNSFAEQDMAGGQPTIICMLQDRSGMIWCGTQKDGIYRYDGKVFTHFLHNDSVTNTSGIRLNGNISAIAEDKKGNIWFTTWFEGVCRFDGKSLTNYKPNKEVWFGSVFEDRKGNLWIGRRHLGVCRYDGEKFINVQQKGLFDSCGVCGMAEDKEGNLWFGTEFGSIATRDSFGGVWRYDGNLFTNFTVKDGISNNCVFSVTTDRSGKMWFGTRNNGLCSYDGKSFTDYSDRQSKNIHHIFEDKAGNIWFGTNGDGARCYDATAAAKGGKAFISYNVSDGLSGADVRCIAQDNAGNLWFGTNGGVSRYDGRQFTNYTVKDGLVSNEVWSMLIDKTGIVWVGTQEGVCRYDPAAGKSTFAAFAIPEATQDDFSRDVTGTKVVWDIKEDKTGNIWLATNGGGVYCYNRKQAPGSLTRITEQDGLCSNFVNCILEDKKGRLWLATQHGGVCRYDVHAPVGIGRFTGLTYKEGLCSNEDGAIYEDRAGNIWIAGKECGLGRYDGKAMTNFADKEGLPGKNTIQSILEDRRGNLWIGSSGGLYRFDGKSFVNLGREWALGVM